MAAAMVRAWRGLLRATMKNAIVRINSVIAYNNKHPTLGLLSSSDFLTLTQAVALLEVKLDATKPR